MGEALGVDPHRAVLGHLDVERPDVRLDRVRPGVDAAVLVEEPVGRDRRVPAEVDLLGRRIVRQFPVGDVARFDERRLRDGEFTCDGLHLLGREPLSVRDDPGGVPRERFGRERVDDGDASRVRIGHVSSEGTTR